MDKEYIRNHNQNTLTALFDRMVAYKVI